MTEYERGWAEGWAEGCVAEADARVEGLTPEQVEIVDLIRGMFALTARDPLERVVTVAFIMERSWWRRVKLAWRLVGRR